MKRCGKILALCILSIGLAAFTGGDLVLAQKGVGKKQDPHHHYGNALKQLHEAKHALVAATSKELSERVLERGVVHELEKAIEAVGRAIKHTEHARKLDNKQ